MKRALAWLLSLATLTITLGACSKGGAADADAPVVVFAAASLRAVVDDVAARFEATEGVDVTLSYAASSTLARQIAEGAPADVFLSANAAWLAWAAERDLIAPDSRVELASNGLVVIAPADAPFAWAPGAPLADAFEGRLAIADPDHVPVGLYAKEALTRLGAWDALASRVAPAADAPAAVRFVTSGAAAAGIAYATDVRGVSGVVVVGPLPADSHAPIRYVGAAVRDRDRPVVARFLAFLTGPEGRAAFAARGFLPPIQPGG